jgi:glutathione S-transferase
MSEPVVFGAAYSVYVRIVRLALEEKGVPYRLEEVDIFAEGGPPADYLARQPFARIPAFEHEGFRLFETAAITRYLDEVFDGPALVPADAKGRARMNQIVGLLDAYAYRALVWDVYVERINVPQEGGVSDEARIAAGLRTAGTCLATLEDLMGVGDFLAGPALTLADLHAAPMIECLRAPPEGAALLDRHPAIGGWWARMAARPSMAATAFPET